MIFTQPFPWHSSVEFNFVHITHRETYIAVQLGYNTTREKLLLLESLVSDKTESFLGVRILELPCIYKFVKEFQTAAKDIK